MPIVQKLNQDHGQFKSVVEVGCGSLGMAPYLKRKLVGLDIYFDKKLIYPDLIAVKGSVLKIPFADNSFDYVINVDMLEHLTKADRSLAVGEMLRIARKCLIIGVPCGSLAQDQDRQIATLYKKAREHQFAYLEEHLQNNLPEEKDIRDLINQQSQIQQKNIDIMVQGNINLQLRKWLMRGWLTKNILVDIFFRKLLIFSVPLMQQMNYEPTYRKIFYITVK